MKKTVFILFLLVVCQTSFYGQKYRGVVDLGFAAGPSSAQMMWRGWGSKPVWRLLLYSQEPQPEFRAVVIIDAGNGEVLEKVVEENPEDWS